MEFNIGDHVFLKVSPMRFGKKGKLSPRYVEPFQILERVGDVAYKVALPPKLANLHDVFHVSMLTKYHMDPTHILGFETIEVDENIGSKGAIFFGTRLFHWLRSYDNIIG